MVHLQPLVNHGLQGQVHAVEDLGMALHAITRIVDKIIQQDDEHPQISSDDTLTLSAQLHG